METFMNELSLQDFELFQMTIGEPSISVTRNGVTFSKSAIIKLGKPEYVKLLIQHERKLAAVVRSTSEEEEAILFLSPQKKTISVRWNNRDLLNTLWQLMKWSPDGRYSITGIYNHDLEAMIFDLKDYKLIGE